MKKVQPQEPSVKIGGGSFRIGFVRAYGSKELFVNDKKVRELVSFTADIDDYLGSIWDKCHEADMLKSSETETEFDPETGEPITPVIEPVKKTATKRNSESKKE